MLDKLRSGLESKLGRVATIGAITGAAMSLANNAQSEITVHFDADPSAAIPGHEVTLTDWEVTLYRVEGDDTKIKYDLRNVVNPQEGMVVQGYILNVPEFEGEVTKDGIMAPANIRTLPGEDLGSTGQHTEMPGTETQEIDNIYELMSAMGTGVPFYETTQEGIKQIAFDNDGIFFEEGKEANRQSVEKYNRLFDLAEFTEYNSSQGDPLGWEPGKFAVYRAIWQDGGQFNGQTNIATATTLYNKNFANLSTTDEETFEQMINVNSSPFANSIVDVVADSYLKMIGVNTLSDVKDENGDKGGYFQIGDLGIETVPQLHGPNTPIPIGELLQDSRLDANGSAELYISESPISVQSTTLGNVKAMFR